MTESKHYDAIVIGSGFAGAVTACRLAEAGLNVCILERGRRFRAEDNDFPVHPVTNDSSVPSEEPNDSRDTVQPDVSRLFWGLGNGVWDFRDLGGVLVGQAAGFGGGSLIYANVHLRPPAHVFDARWPMTRTELEPYFDLVAQKLQVEPLPDKHAGLPKRIQLERAARELNQFQLDHEAIDPKAEETYLRSFSPPLAVNFREENNQQGVCDLKGNCCFGCPKKAKNTLDLNYLQIAERDAEVQTLAEVIWIQRVEDGDRRFKVDYRDHLAGKALESVYGKHVFLCAGAVNTTELLLRCREAKKLGELTGAGLGTGFYPNQDALAAVFDCDEPQDLDRGPTITSSLVYDRQPGDHESSARWRLGFTGAAFEPSVGTEIECASGGTALVATPAYRIAGSYEEGNAIGELTLAKLDGAFDKDAPLTTGAGPCGKVDIPPSKLRQWFLVQDGGLPVELEPMLGVFRSPLWLRRNAFREEQRHPGEYPWPPERRDEHGHDHVEHAAASQRIGYAPLPLEALTDLISGLTRGAAGPQLHEVSEIGLQLLREPNPDRNHEDDKDRWALLPRQLESALHKLRRRTLDGVGLASEGIVSAFLEDAAERVSKQLEGGLAWVGGDQPKEMQSKLADLDLASRALRLGVQLLWGSQAGLARAIAEQLVTMALPSRGQLMEAGVDLLKRVLDYRLGNGRAAMLLSMGLDSAPGRLELELPNLPRVGTELRGATSGTRAFLLKTELEPYTSFPDETAEGTMIITGETGAFEADEILFVGQQKIGKFDQHKPLDTNERFEMLSSSEGSPSLPLRAVRFKPEERRKGRSLASTAPLRATLPPAHDTPERGVQERVLRDLASAWEGELRTDPLWTFLDRRVTVHAQGGCPMGTDDRGVTDKWGEVHGCPGLYVMDAAAFPGPVGANPSATIAAVAEYKIFKFLESLLGEGASEVTALKAKRNAAAQWVNKRGRERLDPLGHGAPERRSVEPAHQPVGIEFTERMIGTERGDGARPIDMELRARIDDLADFLARHTRDSNVRLPIVDGSLKIGEDKWFIEPATSFMRVMAQRGLDESGREVRTIEYKVFPRGIDGRHNWLEGTKSIRDDPGFDTWEDTTTLIFTLHQDGVPSEGVLELPAAEFFGGQLPSFRVDTDDPARQAWAMASFGQFFFGNLVDVYFPVLGQLGTLGSSLRRRGHG